MLDGRPGLGQDVGVPSPPVQKHASQKHDGPTWIHGTPRLACDVAGDGPPVMFLHGIGGGRINWMTQTPAFPDFTTVAWDARGYGASDDYEGELAFTDFADDVARALDQLGVDRAHLVGLSMGARILMDFFTRYADRVATLTLCDCFYGFRSSLSSEKQQEFLDLRERPLRSGRTLEDLAPALVDSLIGRKATVAAREALTRSITALHVESYLKTLRATVTFERADDLADFDVPVQLIFGSDDRLTPPSIGDEMLTLLPHARLHVIEDAGHLSNIEKPDEFNRVLRDFLDEHRGLASWISDPARKG